jgi:hypothetical protein
LIWLTWRQFRVQATVAAVIVVWFAALLRVTGPLLASLYAGSKVGSCHGGPDACGAFANNFLEQLGDGSWTAPPGIASWFVTHVAGGYGPLYMFGIVIILAAPGVIGIFWGAPLVASEFEAGTHYLAWTQSITRTRWLVAKLTLTGLAAMAFAEALSLMLALWDTPISQSVARGASGSDLAMNQFSPLVFATHGIAPLAYAAFAFALGVTVGVLVRRAVLAMAITLAIFAGLQVAMPLWIRPHLINPVTRITTLTSWASVDVLIHGNGGFELTPHGFSEPEAWVFSIGQAVNPAGEPVSDFPAACKPGPNTFGKDDQSALLQCLDSHGIRIAVVYDPASRYWPFQWTETAVYVALALAMVGYCFWRLRRRLS